MTWGLVHPDDMSPAFRSHPYFVRYLGWWLLASWWGQLAGTASRFAPRWVRGRLVLFCVAEETTAVVWAQLVEAGILTDLAEGSDGG